MKRKLSLLIASLIFVSFTGLAVYGATNHKEEIHRKNIEIESKTFRLQKIEVDYKKLNSDLEAERHKDTQDQQKIQQLEQEKKDLEEKYRQLEVSKANQKAEQQRLAQTSITPKASAATNISGNKQTWLEASGIPSDQWWAVDYIVSRESGWNPCAYNPGKSNCNMSASEVNATQGRGVACGLGQSLPCGKWGLNWTDPVNQLKNQYIYVTQRYGGYPQAVNFWKANGHY